MFKHTAVIDGVTFTRSSEGRTYTHCIVIKVLLARERAEAEAFFRKHHVTEERVAADMADYDARIAKSKQISSDGKYHYLGGSEWCGRPDLALKALGKWTKRGEHAIAVEAAVVETKKRVAKS